MAETSKWWDAPWNPFGGCTPVSPACRLCYARRWHERLRAQGSKRYDFPFDEFRVRWEMLHDPAPLRWRRPHVVFVNNLSDTFHGEAPLAALLGLFWIMREADRHAFLVLTKRPMRMLAFARNELAHAWPANVWAGVTVEAPEYLDRLDALLRVPARVRFLSVEPLLGQVADHVTPEQLKGLHWLIVGGETGPANEQPVRADADEVRNLRDLCEANEIPFWFKQWGGTATPPSEAPELDGRTWLERPPPTSNS